MWCVSSGTYGVFLEAHIVFLAAHHISRDTCGVFLVVHGVFLEAHMVCF